MNLSIGNILDIILHNSNVGIAIKILIIALTTWFISKSLKRIYKSKIDKNNSLFGKFIYNIALAVIYLLGLLLIIGQIPDLNNLTQTILAGSGILALGISLSAQESLNNIISGLFITLFKPFEVGDRVTLVNSKITGTIEDITLRHTVVKTFINSRVVIPNSTINKEIIENSNLIDSKASSFIDIGVAYESDIQEAMRIMADIIGNHPLFIDTRSEDEKLRNPKVKVYVRELGSSAVMLRASMWTQTVGDNFDACSDVRLQIKEEFDKAGIEIPYTKYKIITEE